jgi:hypothetical protein
MGPCFGEGELVVYEPFNKDCKCFSSPNYEGGYNIAMDRECRCMLTNVICEKRGFLYRSNFEISELEVWEVTFEK